PPAPGRLVEYPAPRRRELLAQLLRARLARLERVGLTAQVGDRVAQVLQAVVERLAGRGALLGLEAGVGQRLARLVHLLLAGLLLGLAGAQGGLPALGLVGRGAGHLVEQRPRLGELARFAQGDGVVVLEQDRPAGPRRVARQVRLVLLAALVQLLRGVGGAVLAAQQRRQV